MIFWTYGCQSTCKSLVDPERKVNRDELQAEVDGYLAMAKARFTDLDRQDQLKLLIFEQASLFAQSGTVNPMGLVTTAVSIAAVGFGLDARRKKKEIEKTTTATTTTAPSA